VNWVIPFGTLLSFKAKQRPAVLKAVCVLLLAGHWLDLYLQVVPALSPAPAIGPREIGIALGYLAVAFLLYTRNLGRASLVPLGDPVLAADAAAVHAHVHS